MGNAATPDYRLRDVFVSGFDAGRAIPYTGHNRERPLPDDAMAYATALRAAHHGDATDYYLMKESGVQDTQDDPYAPRRAQFEAQFQALPPTGGDDYWRRIEEPIAEQRLPLEVLARCLRERHAAGAVGDADRVLNVIWLQVQPQVRKWSRDVAGMARSGMKPELREDLEQECFIKLWQELNDVDDGDDEIFLLTYFEIAFLRLRQHVAQDVMKKAGEWQRPGVDKPTRIPTDAIDSIQATSEREGDFPLDDQLEDMAAQAPFRQAELSDLFEKVRALPEDQRTAIIDRFWKGLSQDETAAKLGITPRMVRYLLRKALRELGEQYGAGEEGNGV
jgi:RNA polymerase sigma factor (sigma-70 family)